jgi:hypothetical protein
MVLKIARWPGPPRLLLAPLAVLSPGPRLAGTQNGQEKMAGNGGFFECQRRHFPCLETGFLNTSARDSFFYVGRLFWRLRARKMSGRHFRAWAGSTRRPEAVYAQTLQILGPAADTEGPPRDRPKTDGLTPYAT